ncbi:hypothetical protein HGRIS_007569 [Hohenbuehelia grisea]|uniref:WSC domain-containing protein n=1 Tax=Hohenbuehelia grisea TaxID=104357 RepID=A0ABR3J598_9AGAR
MAPFKLTTATLVLAALLGAEARVLQRRTDIPRTLPSPWVSKGCFTDSVSARALRGASFSDDKMTVESCLGFCSSGGYTHAGVEFGRECFCGFNVEAPGAQAGDDCHMPCSGNGNQACGAGDRLNLFHNGGSAPKTAETVNGFTYQGCFTDSVASRTLPTRLDLGSAATIEKCVSACGGAGFSFAGLEFGDECWCGNNTGSSQKADPATCNMTCKGNGKQICGGGDRLTLYKATSGGGGGGGGSTQSCIKDLAHFKPLARLKVIPGSNGGARPVPIDFTIVGGARNVGWGPLTSGPLPPSLNPPFTLEDFALRNGVLIAQPTIKKQAPAGIFWDSVVVSHSVAAGESPLVARYFSNIGSGGAQTDEQLQKNFEAHISNRGLSAYCALDEGNGGRVLAVNGVADRWSLCANTTANGRIDLVFDRQRGHAHYSFDECKEVRISV